MGVNERGDQDRVSHQAEGSSEDIVSKSMTLDEVVLKETIHIGDPGNHAVAGLPSKGIGDLPDTEIDWGKHGKVQVRAASVRGRLHRYEGSLRQDAFALQFHATNNFSYSIAAVSDGVGSLPLSHIAASIAARSVVKKIKSQLGDVDSIFFNSSDTFQWTIESLNREIKGVCPEEINMACTLIVAVVCTSNLEPNSNATCRVLRLGDSSAWLLSEQRWLCLSRTSPEEYGLDSNKVSALPFAKNGWHADTDVILPDNSAVFLMTDGIGEPLGDGQSMLGNYLATCWGEPPAPFHFGHTIDFARRSHMDDRTAVGLWVR
jgi:hypothetical protein